MIPSKCNYHKKKISQQKLINLYNVLIIFTVFIASSLSIATNRGKYLMQTSADFNINDKQKLSSSKTAYHPFSSTSQALDEQKITKSHDKVYKTYNNEAKETSQNYKYTGQDDQFQWPQTGKSYRIYSLSNSHLVMDVAKLQDESLHLIMYKWMGSKNQYFNFQLSHDNFYYITNRYYYGQYLTKSSKTKEYQGKTAHLITLNHQKKILYQLIPVKKGIPNAFYIINQDQDAIDIIQLQAYQKSSPILYKFLKKRNQIWVIKEIDYNSYQPVPLEQEYDQKLSQTMYNIQGAQNKMYASFSLDGLKEEMNENYVPIPQWLQVPAKYTPEIYDMPPEINSGQFEKMINKKHSNTHEMGQIPHESGVSNLQNSSTQETSEWKKSSLDSQYFSVECAKRHKVAYVWLGEKDFPLEYRYLLKKCKQNVILLTDEHFNEYSKRWNFLGGVNKIDPNADIRLRVNLLKLLYLYFEGGVYADFDTQINERCWGEVYADQVVFTNRIIDGRDVEASTFPVEQIVIPEENFMMARKKLSPQVWRMINNEIEEYWEDEGDRWRECKYRQCLIVMCQRHYRDNTYLKGYN